MQSRMRWGAGALVGWVSAGVAIGVGEAVAAFVRPASAPAVAVGNRLIVLTPQPVKEWAIRTFGSSDKQTLLAGIYLVLALLSVVVGVLALRRLVYGLAGIAVFGAFGCYCALTANASHGDDVVPTLVGTAAAAIAMGLLVHAAGRGDATPATEPGDARGALTGRRQFLQGSVGFGGLALLVGFGGRAVGQARSSVAKVRAKVALPSPASPAPALTGHPDLGKSGVPWQTPNAEFYRVDTALSVPQVDPAAWSLRIHGMVDHPIELRYAQLLDRPLIERWITLCCVSNVVGGGLIGNAKFLGARLADLLREAGVHPDADELVMTSVDGMTIGSPTAVVMDGRDSMLAVGMNGVPLPTEHGFPVRVVVPGLYGYVSACKWVVDIEATTFNKARAYWVQGGWAAQTDIKLASRIDTPRPGQRLAVGKPVAIAGVAWDQHVGVSAVDVQAGDNGPWLKARLASVPSTDTWRQWVAVWTPPAAGTYTLWVRATDAKGNAQTRERQDPYPSGATGWDAVIVHVA